MTIFNHHKYKKKWGRGIKKASNFIFSSSADTLHKDFDWRQRKRNPFWQKSEDFDWKKKIEISVIGLTILTILGVLIFSQFFYIKKVSIQGLQRISEDEVKSATLGVADCRRFLVLPGKNYFLVDLDEIRDILKQKFSIESIVIKKTFPDTLNIVIQEKISTLIYDNGTNYSYIGTDGHIVEILRKVGENEWQTKTETTTSTNEKGEIVSDTKIIEKNHTPIVKDIVTEMGDYPIVFDQRLKPANLNEQVLNPKIVAGIIDWFNFITKQTNIPFGYIVLNSELGDATIKTREGWELMVKLDKNIPEQCKELEYVLKEKTDRNNLNYIDLRYLGKVYWQ